MLLCAVSLRIQWRGSTEMFGSGRCTFGDLTESAVPPPHGFVPPDGSLAFFDLDTGRCCHRGADRRAPAHASPVASPLGAAGKDHCGFVVRIDPKRATGRRALGHH